MVVNIIYIILYNKIIFMCKKNVESKNYGKGIELFCLKKIWCDIFLLESVNIRFYTLSLLNLFINLFILPKITSLSLLEQKSWIHGKLIWLVSCKLWTPSHVDFFFFSNVDLKLLLSFFFFFFYIVITFI